MKGKVATILGLEFGEMVMWSNKRKVGKLSPQWKMGVFLGVNPISGEATVVDAEGVRDVRSVHRRPVELRWNTEAAALLLGGLPITRVIEARESMPYVDPPDVSEGGIEGWDHERAAPSHERRRRK